MEPAIAHDGHAQDRTDLLVREEIVQRPGVERRDIGDEERLALRQNRGHHLVVFERDILQLVLHRRDPRGAPFLRVEPSPLAPHEEIGPLGLAGGAELAQHRGDCMVQPVGRRAQKGVQRADHQGKMRGLGRGGVKMADRCGWHRGSGSENCAGSSDTAGSEFCNGK